MSKQQDVTINVGGKDTGASATIDKLRTKVQQLEGTVQRTSNATIRNMKNAFGESSALGGWAMAIRGGGALAGIYAISDMLQKASAKMVELQEQSRTTALNWADWTQEIAKSIPLLGNIVEFGENFNEMLTHSKQIAKDLADSYKAIDDAWKARIEQQKQSLKFDEQSAKFWREAAANREILFAGKDRRPAILGQYKIDMGNAVRPESERMEERAKYLEEYNKEAQALREAYRAQENALREKESFQYPKVDPQKYSLGQNDPQYKLDAANREKALQPDRDALESLRQRSQKASKARMEAESKFDAEWENQRAKRERAAADKRDKAMADREKERIADMREFGAAVRKVDAENRAAEFELNKKAFDAKREQQQEAHYQELDRLDQWRKEQLEKYTQPAEKQETEARYKLAVESQTKSNKLASDKIDEEERLHNQEMLRERESFQRRIVESEVETAARLLEAKGDSYTADLMRQREAHKRQLDELDQWLRQMAEKDPANFKQYKQQYIRGRQAAENANTQNIMQIEEQRRKGILDLEKENINSKLALLDRQASLGSYAAKQDADTIRLGMDYVERREALMKKEQAASNAQEKEAAQRAIAALDAETKAKTEDIKRGQLGSLFTTAMATIESQTLTGVSLQKTLLVPLDKIVANTSRTARAIETSSPDAMFKAFKDALREVITSANI